ncbi:MAG: lipopolysaccharide kinase InaA family protein, partial [Planctomycetota bacterium]
MKGFVDEPLRSSIGEADPMRWLAERPAAVIRDKPGRRTIRFELNGNRFFAKLHSGPGVREVIKELSSLRTPPLDAGREAHALAHLAARSVPVPRLVAWGVRGRWPGARASFLVTEDVGTQRTAGDALRAIPNGD